MSFRNARMFAVPRAIALGFVALGFAALALTARAQSTAAQPDAAAIERGAEIAYVRALEKAAAAKSLDVDRERLAEIRRVGAALIEPARKAKPESANWAWAFHLETRDEPLAWCLPGGKVLVSTGLFDRYEPTTPEFAALLAHVVAHALAGETAAAVKREFVQRGHAVSPDPNRNALHIAELLPAVLATPHDAASEGAADVLGLQLTANAAVDPRPAIEAWRKVGRGASASPPGFGAVHPVSPERLAALEARMPAMVTVYETALRELPPAPPPPAKGKRPQRKH